MSRISVKDVEKREEESLVAFRSGSSVRKVNEALKLKYGKTMSLKRLYELKKMIDSENSEEPKVEQ
jgi:hypothetical protein